MVEIQGRSLTYPVRIGDAAAACAVYAVRTVDLPAGLTPVRVAGRALAVVGLVRYRVNDLGVYDELALAHPVRHEGRTGIHITQLPVTEEFTREVGATLWGLPKWLGEADLAFGRGRADGTLRYAGTRVLTAAIAAFLPVPGIRGAVTAFAPRDGAMLASPVSARLRGVRIGYRATVTPGSGHPMADELRALPRRPLLTATVEHLAFDMGPAVTR